MKKLLFCLPLLLLLSFAPAESGKFDRSGVSFSIPTGWKITEEQDLEGKGYYLSCEKEGANSSGLVTVSWVNDSLDLDAMTGQYSEALAANFTEQKADPKLGPIVSRTFNGMEARGFDYTMNIQGIAHEGHVYCFFGKDKTINVMVQEAVEDKAANKAGIAEITASLKSN